MHIGSSEPERVDSRKCRAIAIGQRSHLLWNPQSQGFKIDIRIELVDQDIRRNLVVFENQSCLDQPSHPGTRFEVTDICFH